jgi:hypothetical protein
MLMDPWVDTESFLSFSDELIITYCTSFRQNKHHLFLLEFTSEELF